MKMKIENNIKFEPVANANDFIGISINDNQIILKTPLCFRIEDDERLLKKNIILFLSSKTKNSRALREEIDYGVNVLKLPIIVVYPEFTTYSELLSVNGQFKNEVTQLWDNLPIFRDSKKNIPVLHVPLNKSLLHNALLNKGFTVQSPLESKD